MKKTIVSVLVIVFVILLSGCQKIDIKPNVIDVQYENVRWEGSSIVVDVFITNGYDRDKFIGYMEFALYFPDEQREFCGAGFDIEETFKADSYIEYEIEFTSEFVFFTQSDLDAEDITLDDLVLIFYLEE